MLTAELVKPRIRMLGSQLFIDLLTIHDAGWLRVATDLIALLKKQQDQPLGTWEHAIEEYEGERLDYVVVRGIAKVLTDAATFTPLLTPLPSAELRLRLFAHGPVFSTTQLLQQQARNEIMQNQANALAISHVQLEEALFADRPVAARLTDVGPDWTPEGLLARYNLELARGVLYWASHVRIEVHGGYKDLWKYIKLFKLMFWIQAQEDDGYIVDLDGPISPFVSATLRYGRQFAAFLPALLLCERWNMVAQVRSPQTWKMATYRLDASAELQSHFKQSGLFDSRLEADFAHEFEEKFGSQRGQWVLTREDEVLNLGHTVMIPDFALTHKRTEQRILIELVGFWHPDYLRRKVEKVRAAQCHNLLLLVYEGVNLAADALQDVPGEVLYFKNKPVLKDVMSIVEAMAARLHEPG
jgi:predicted nuclease of restriction endonuclease-like RecB superfamily